MCPLMLANLAAEVSEEDGVGEEDGMAELKASRRAVCLQRVPTGRFSHERITGITLTLR